MRRTLSAVAALATLSMLAACTGGVVGEEAEPATTGPIDIWYSNYPPEIEWVTAAIETWNAANPDQEITGQEIPVTTSTEEAVMAAIAAGNTPCLILNGAQLAIADYERMGGLVSLSDFEGADEYIESRSGVGVAQQYQSADGTYKQIPWKSNPLMLFYNKDVFAAAGLDPENPGLESFDDVLEAGRAIVESGAAQYLATPATSAEFYQPFFDFYPLFAAESDGRMLVEDGEPQFNSEAGIAVSEFWNSVYEEGLAPKDMSVTSADPFADGSAAMRFAGPWAIPLYDVNWGVIALPTSSGNGGELTWSFADAKTISMYSSCENQDTAWEVIKFFTSEEQDLSFLEDTGQMPMRVGLPELAADYFAENPEYEIFAAQAAKTVEVPYVNDSVAVWQAVRDAYLKSVVFPEADIESAFQEAADQVIGLLAAN